MDSLWCSGAEPLGSDPVPDGSSYDDVVVGAGLTGLTTALLLARAGRKVAVLEAREIGAVATGHTTAKLSLLQGTKLSALRRVQSQEVTRAYVDANREGQQWLLQFCADHAVPVQSRDAVTYAASPEELAAVRREHDVAGELGLDVHWVDRLEVPFPHCAATVLPAQAQFDPMQVLVSLCQEVRSHGGVVHQGHRVTRVTYAGSPDVALSDGRRVRAGNVVLATGSPILDRGLYFAKLEAHRSYALAFDLDITLPGMYLSAGPSTRSVRDAPGEPGKLLVGGNGHPVGRTRSEAAHLDVLRRWAREHFPDAVETHAWSAQDYRSHDGFPYVGALPRGGGNIYLATGYDKWGITNAVAAARSITATILGAPTSWSRPLNRRITRPGPAARVAEINARTALVAVRSLASLAMRKPSGAPTGGAGVNRREGVLPTATARVDGETCSVLGICTHLGGVLHWNDAERSWDCPLHGSRFSPQGEVLEGPATKPLVTRGGS